MEPGGEPPKTQPPPPPSDPDFGLGVAQIVITAATPMVEEAEKPFPAPPSPPAAEESSVDEPEESAAEVPPDYTTVCEEKPAVPEEPDDDQPTDSAPFPISSSTGSEEDSYTGPSTAENSQSHPHPAPATAPATRPEPSIPDELEPHQLARLQDLKESDA